MTIARWHVQIGLAFSFLTILPSGVRQADESDVAASMAWFPAVGWYLGSTFAIELYFLASLFGPMTRSALVVLSMVIITGAVHLDGLADTADALGAGRDRTRGLEILRDSRIGTFGAAAVFFALALKVLALARIESFYESLMLIIAMTLSRWSLVAVSYKMEYLRSEGAGSSMLGRLDNRNFTIASIIAVLPLIWLHWTSALIAYALAVIVSFAIRWFYRRWLGGITGDLIGACGEIVEVLVMLTMAAR